MACRLKVNSMWINIWLLLYVATCLTSEFIIYNYLCLCHIMSCFVNNYVFELCSAWICDQFICLVSWLLSNQSLLECSCFVYVYAMLCMDLWPIYMFGLFAFVQPVVVGMFLLCISLCHAVHGFVTNLYVWSLCFCPTRGCWNVFVAL
jgi:hypothetical protein